jgi:RNA methyltransferase, TrmH family
MITSSHNPKIQAVRNLLARRKERDERSQFVVEGVRLAEEAYQAGWLPAWVLTGESLSERGRSLANAFARLGIEVEQVSSSLMETLGDTETSQGLLVVMPARELTLPERLVFVLVADALRDPGNLGALLRTAAAAGVQAVFLTPGTVDAFSPKVLRSGMGAQFRLPVRNVTWDQILLVCHQPAAPLTLYLAEAGEGQSLWQTDLRRPLALVVGGEANGASEAGRAAADSFISIPMPGKSESLNAAIAASIILFEVVRQRNQRNS